VIRSEFDPVHNEPDVADAVAAGITPVGVERGLDLGGGQVLDERIEELADRALADALDEGVEALAPTPFTKRL